MIISEKCNCCLHDGVCSFKEEYLKLCETIKNSSYRFGENLQNQKFIKDSNIDVHIRCPHMMTQGTMRKATGNDPKRYID